MAIDWQDVMRAVAAKRAPASNAAVTAAELRTDPDPAAALALTTHLNLLSDLAGFMATRAAPGG